MVLTLLSVISFLLVTRIKSENCITPDKVTGECISLYTCPTLVHVMAKAEKGVDEYVRKSRCGLTSTDPLVCCPLESAKSCSTPNGKMGECLSLTSCPNLINLLTSQKPPDIDYVRKSSCGLTASDALVCCPLDTTTKQTRPNSPTIDESLLPSKKVCGYQHSDDYSTKPESATITEFPWLAGLVYLIRGEVVIRCQGAVINTRYILTAAHCVSSLGTARLVAIRLGEYNIRNSTDCIEDQSFTECSDPVQEYGVEEYVVHPMYGARPASKHDIALIRLNETIPSYSDYIRPICLPLPGFVPAQIGQTLITTGWGKTKASVYSDVKKKVFNKLITNADCQNAYYAAAKRIVNVTDSMMCTQEPSDNRDFSCIGDSGGPVMSSHKLQWYVEGVNSFGANECGEKYPVVHTKVTSYIDWIMSSMRPL